MGGKAPPASSDRKLCSPHWFYFRAYTAQLISARGGLALVHLTSIQANILTTTRFKGHRRLSLRPILSPVIVHHGTSLVFVILRLKWLPDPFPQKYLPQIMVIVRFPITAIL